MSRKHGRNTPVIRTFDLFFELAAHHFGMTVGEIGAFLGVNRRTVYRYLEALEDAGVTLRSERRPARDGSGIRRMIRLVAIRGYGLRRLA